jgi:hypothetical protein
MAKIGRAQIVVPRQLSHETSELVLRRVLVPGASVERYRRIWRLGHTVTDNGFIVGRIGFESERETFTWNAETRDFTPSPTPNGQVVPFVVALEAFTVVFQIRPPSIRPRSFTGALEEILSSSGTSEYWRVESLTRRIPFEEWRASVDKVTRMHFHIEQPNPNWEGRPQLEELMRRLGDLDSADFGFAAENGILTDDELIVELINHVQRDYGRGTMVGSRETRRIVTESVLDTTAGEIEEVSSLEEVSPGDVALARLMREIAQDEATEDSEETQADV